MIPEEKEPKKFMAHGWRIVRVNWRFERDGVVSGGLVVVSAVSGVVEVLMDE